MNLRRLRSLKPSLASAEIQPGSYKFSAPGVQLIDYDDVRGDDVGGDVVRGKAIQPDLCQAILDTPAVFATRQFRHQRTATGFARPSMNTFKCLTLEKADGVAFVSLLDEKIADPVRVEQLGREMLALADLQPPLIVMSFKGVKFFSSAAINKLIVVERRIKAKNGALILVDLERELKDLFSLSFLDGLFVIREDRSAALAELLSARK